MIGILSQTIQFPGFASHSTYISATYVRFLESSGARIIPILATECDEEVIRKIDMVNGVIFPGGKGDYKRVGRLILSKAMESND